MKPLLYLDTARLGQMLPAARDAHIDFARLAAEEPSSLYFEDFLRGGFHAWPRQYQERFGGLVSWRGVRGLKQSLRTLAGAPDDWQVLLAGRSWPLLELGATCLFRVCRNVLTTDLCWPSYHRTVEAQAARTENRVTVTAIRNHIFSGGWNAADITRRLAHEFTRHGCDGLFLPAVDHLGVRLPVGEIVERIQAVADLRFVLIDAAQALCHTALNDSFEHADFIIAGGHKWMGAYLPSGFAFFGRHRSRELVAHRLRRKLCLSRLPDPVMKFSEQIVGGPVDGHSETANLASLFACAGAASHRLGRARFDATSVSDVDRALRITPRPNEAWTPVRISPELRSRITLMQGKHTPARPPTATDVRRDWMAAGCIVTGYDNGWARLGFP